jgi:hypothetical protein
MSVMLVFICPETGREVPVCILRGGEELKNLGQHEIKCACMVCGGSHCWTIGEGRLAMGETEPRPTPKVARVP